ncbi:hypothetical protein RirG_052920 [Rhizophagus irregularis DAOM 197198w]|uniref:Uncharacterized protein n=1 Tax=Rhizophagus irregularis (strain DAOM 197198w) TaxID=1432141 RepID=A0A015L3J3_RHIIW|nr:hypothetical protein RirG_052920 [Rhizophagus irregularis DAOM 197198w]
MPLIKKSLNIFKILFQLPPLLLLPYRICLNDGLMLMRRLLMSLQLFLIHLWILLPLKNMVGSEQRSETIVKKLNQSLANHFQ